jgi:hypothetical protein
MHSRISLDREGWFVQNREEIRSVYSYAAILLATIPALFRSQREQGISELALRQFQPLCSSGPSAGLVFGGLRTL